MNEQVDSHWKSNLRSLVIDRSQDHHFRFREKWLEWLWLALLLFLAVSYALANLLYPRVLSGASNIYFVQPLTWIATAALAYVGWRHGHYRRLDTQKRVKGMALVTGLFQISVLILAGLFFGFGHSPYTHEGFALLGNLLYIGSLVVAFEISRAYLVSVFSQGNTLLGILSPSLLFACLSIPLAKYTSIADPQNFFKFTGETFLPAFSENLLASFLVFLGGPAASLLYRGLIVAFEWLSPVLPNLQWTMTAFLGTMIPAFGLIVIRNQFLVDDGTLADEDQSRRGTSSLWVVALALAVGVLWFNSGLFSIRPTLVNGVSMEPELMVGDVVITRDVAPEEIRVDDIIRFQQGGIYIIHRVIDIEYQGDEILFITQGDANNVVDPPVKAKQIEGKVILTLPKIGWLSIWVRNLIAWIA